MAKDLSVLQSQIEAIKTEVNKGANTSERIGGMFGDMLDYNEEKLTELSSNVGLYNVDKSVPLDSGFYTASTARNAVPTSVRKLGLIITYKTDASTSVIEQFIGSSVSVWTLDANWKNVGSEGGNKILEWNTDAATTRKQVPLKERKAGLQISYTPDGINWINEQYVGVVSDSNWDKDNNWIKIPNIKEVVANANPFYPFSASCAYMLTGLNAGMDVNIAKATFFGIYIEGTKKKLHIDSMSKDTALSVLSVTIADESNTQILRAKDIPFSDNIQIVEFEELKSSGYSGLLAIKTNGYTANGFNNTISNGNFQLSDNIFLKQTIFEEYLDKIKPYDLYKGAIPFNLFTDYGLDNYSKYFLNYGGSISTFEKVADGDFNSVKVTFKTNKAFAFSLDLNKTISIDSSVEYFTTFVIKAIDDVSLEYAPLRNINSRTILKLKAGQSKRITVNQTGGTSVVFFVDPISSTEEDKAVVVYSPIVEKQYASKNNRVLSAKIIMDNLQETYGGFSSKQNIYPANLNYMPDFKILSSPNSRFTKAGFAAIGGSSSFEFIEKDGFAWIKATKNSSSDFLGIITGTKLLETIPENQSLRVAIVFYCDTTVSISIDILEGKRNYKQLNDGYNVLDFDASTALKENRDEITDLTVIAQDSYFPVGTSIMYLPLFLYYAEKPLYHLLYHSSFEIYKSNKLYNKKFVFGGDSISAQQRWIKYLEKVFPPLLYGREISASNVGGTGNQPTAVGGSALTPIVTSNTGQGAGQSLYERSKSFKNYNPDVIVIYIGANDMGFISPYDSYEEAEAALLEYKQEHPDYNPATNKWWLWEGSMPLGSVNDEAYTGNEITINLSDEEYGGALFKYSSDGSSIDWRIPKTLTFTSAYKGMLDRLTSEMHGVKIYLCTNVPFFAGGFDTIPDERFEAQKAMAQKVREIAEYYGLPLIDNWENAGINRYNYRKTGEENPYLGDGIHPTELGGEMIGFNMANSLGL